MAEQTAAQVFPDDVAIQGMLVERIDVQRQGVGVAVGVIDASGRRIVAHGEPLKDSGLAVDGDTVFRLGSIGKVFTALLLAQMAERGEVRLDDPVATYLPPGVTAPTYQDRQITLVDLATHTSGLPRMDPTHRTSDPDHPAALAGQAQALSDYTAQQMYEFLGRHQLTHEIGGRAEYSNLGMGLLGHVLSLRGGADYETLVSQRITAPLGMLDTVMTPPARLSGRLATGHNQRLAPVADLQLQVLAGAGALRSTARDMLTFLAAQLGYVETPLAAAMAAQRALRRPTRLTREDMALGWHVSRRQGREIVWHSGATVGSSAYLGFDAALGAGVVVLTNTRGTTNESLALRLLNGAAPAAGHPPADAIALSADVLERYVGRYAFAPRSHLVVTRQGDRLFAQRIAGGVTLPVREIYPQSPTYFCWKDADVEATFQIDDTGQVTGLALHQFGGRDAPARRESPSPA